MVSRKKEEKGVTVIDDSGSSTSDSETEGYKEGSFGYWWVVVKGNQDICGKVYKGDICCSNCGLTSLEGCPKEVKGNFDCSHNKLTSLKGCPTEVKGNFDFSYNVIVQLKYGPEKIGGKIICSCDALDDQVDYSTAAKTAKAIYPEGSFGYWWVVKKGKQDICGKVYEGDIWCSGCGLTSLEGCPKEIRGGFDCSSNKLTLLKGCPEKVEEDFNCSNNKLTSLKGCPKEIRGGFDCSSNEFPSLEGCPEKCFFNFYCNGDNVCIAGCPEYIKGSFVYEYDCNISMHYSGPVGGDKDTLRVLFVDLWRMPKIVDGDVFLTVPRVLAFKIDEDKTRCKKGFFKYYTDQELRFLASEISLDKIEIGFSKVEGNFYWCLTRDFDSTDKFNPEFVTDFLKERIKIGGKVIFLKREDFNERIKRFKHHGGHNNWCFS